MTQSIPRTTRLLEALGLTPDEERVYRSLLAQPESSLAQLARSTDLVQREARKVLVSLEEKGLVSRAASKVARFLPVKPEIALDTLWLRRQEELERARLGIRHIVDDVRSRESQKSSTELVEIVMGRPAITHRYRQLLRSARKEILALDKPPYVTVGGEGSQNNVELELLSGGIRNRAIYDESAFEIPGKLEEIRDVVEAGEEARVLRGLPMRMVIADRSMGLIPLGLRGPELEEGDIMIHASPLLEALALLFELLWERAAPIRFAKSGELIEARGARELSDEDQAVLALLAADMKDRVIASQLGVSLRTVQRRIRNLIEVFGVETRTQLVLEAARRGLV